MMQFFEGNYYMSVVALFVLILEILAVIALKSRKNAARVVVTIFGLWLLFVKTAEYVLFDKVPLDFSVLTYFFFGIVVLLPFRPLKMVASYCGILAGIMYMGAFITTPSSFIVTEPSVVLRFFALVNHNMLLVGGIALLEHIPFRFSDVFWLLGWILLTVGYTLLMVRVFHFDLGNSVFYDILTGSIISRAVPDWQIPVWYYCVYYPAAIGVMFVLFYVSLTVNRKLLRLPKGAKPKLYAY